MGLHGSCLYYDYNAMPVNYPGPVNNVILDRFYGCFSDSKLPDFMFESNSFVSLVIMKFFQNNEKNVR